jgi:hypothetical protein
MKLFYLIFFFLILISCSSDESEQLNSSEAAEETQVVVSYDDTTLVLEEEHVVEKAGVDSIALMRLPKSRMDISGSYEMVLGENSHFMVTLKHRGAYISGSYCGYNETRVDCGMPSQGVSDCQIYGEMKGDTAFVRFMSCYMMKEGAAKIFKKENHIYWITTKFPKSEEGGMSYCGAPTEGLVRNVVRIPVKTVKFNALSPIEFSFSKRDIGKKCPSFSFGVRYVDKGLNKEKGYVNSKQEISIQEKVGSYVYASDEKKGISKDLNVLACKIDSAVFYLKEDCMPIKSFQDNLNNWFLLGMDENNKNLSIKVYNQGSLLDVHSFSVPVFGLDDFGQNYAETFFKVIALRQNNFMNLAFFRLDFESRQCEGIRGSELFYWNGYRLNQLRIPDESIRDAYFVEESIIFPSDINGIKDTLVLNIKTADYGGADDIINQQNFTFYYVMDGMRLKCVKK